MTDNVTNKVNKEFWKKNIVSLYLALILTISLIMNVFFLVKVSNDITQAIYYMERKVNQNIELIKNETIDVNQRIDCLRLEFKKFVEYIKRHNNYSIYK